MGINYSAVRKSSKTIFEKIRAQYLIENIKSHIQNVPKIVSMKYTNIASNIRNCNILIVLYYSILGLPW